MVISEVDSKHALKSVSDSFKIPWLCSRESLFKGKDARFYSVTIATLTFSRVKRSCFRAKAHLVFHWCL